MHKKVRDLRNRLMPTMTAEELEAMQAGKLPGGLKNVHKPYQHKEEDLQKACYEWFRLQYPHLDGLLNYNLNNSSNEVSGSRNKALGLQPGRSDFSFYYNGKAYFIELKTEKGKQSQVQKEWQNLIEKQGFEYYIVRSVEQFMNLIKTIMNT